MHEKWQDMIPFYVAGSLQERDVVELERHLRQCPNCQKAVDEWRMIGDAVRVEADLWAKKLPPLSAHVRASLYAAPDEDHDTIPTSPVSYPAQRRTATPTGRRSWHMMTAAAVVVVIILGGLLALRMMRDSRKDDDVGVVAAAPTDTKPAQQGDLSLMQGPSPTSVRSPQAMIQDLGIIIGTPTPIPPTLPSATPRPSQESQIEQQDVAALLVEATPISRNAAQPTPTTLNPEFILLTPPSDVCTVNSASGVPVNVYSAPDANSAVVNTLPPGEYLYTLVVDGKGWYQVTGRGIGLIGWVWGNQVNLNGNCNDLVLPSPTYNMARDVWGNTPTPTAHFYYSIGMRQYEILTMEQVGGIPAGTRVSVTSAWFDGFTWHYTIITQDGTSYEALQAQLAYAPDADPGAPTPSS